MLYKRCIDTLRAEQLYTHCECHQCKIVILTLQPSDRRRGYTSKHVKRVAESERWAVILSKDVIIFRRVFFPNRSGLVCEMKVWYMYHNIHQRTPMKLYKHLITSMQALYWIGSAAFWAHVYELKFCWSPRENYVKLWKWSILLKKIPFQLSMSEIVQHCLDYMESICNIHMTLQFTYVTWLIHRGSDRFGITWYVLKCKEF